MRCHISKELKDLALKMSLVHGLPDKKIKRYTGISIRALKRLRQTYRETGETVRTPVCSGRPRNLDALDANFLEAMGMVSSHPAACNALCKLLNGDTRDVNLTYIREHASAVLKCSTVQYLKEAQLRGAFLDEEGGSFSAFTAFFVDHNEPLQVLQTYMSRDRWSFGDLLDGHEFLILVPVPVPPASDIDF
ncbi:hypothetical protein BN946_scf185031.g8 [Trametes cinnabarina]|uniref:Uncharacterized protein n=1 Tax=Pycnoporus cinnabarinus TaxID=5643 RepID=A0A060SP76_PYCCI|nr:hypothetical protein BN946_scf185031.g8 [Trametes cinnabarina]